MSHAAVPAVVQRPALLDEAHLPTELVARQTQVDALLFELTGTAERPAGHAWLWGPPGAGKTAVARRVAERFRDAGAVGVAYVPCQRAATAYLVLARAVEELRVLARDWRRDALSRLDVLAKEAQRRRLLLVLDDVDLLPSSERAFLLTALPEVRNVSLVCTASSLEALETAEERVRSRFRPAQVACPGYTEREVVGLLEARAALALTPGTYSRAQLERIASLAAGDARIAVQTLRRAANLSERAGEAFVSDGAIDEAFRAMRDVRRAYALRRLTAHHRLLVDLVAAAREVGARDLWNRYREAARSYGLEPVALRTFQKYMNADLVRARLVALRAEGPWRRRFTYRLAA